MYTCLVVCINLDECKGKECWNCEGMEEGKFCFSSAKQCFLHFDIHRFLFKFTGQDQEINLLGDGTEKAEFGEWSWIPPEKVIELVSICDYYDIFNNCPKPVKIWCRRVNT